MSNPEFPNDTAADMDSAAQRILLANMQAGKGPASLAVTATGKRRRGLSLRARYRCLECGRISSSQNGCRNCGGSDLEVA